MPKWRFFPGRFSLCAVQFVLPVSLFLALPATGQSVVESSSVGALEIGVSVQGTLSGGGGIGDPSDPVLDDGSFFETWALVLDSPGFVSVGLATLEFDPYVFLALSDDTIIGENDDCTPGDLRRSCLNDIPAEAGTYYVGVNSFGAGETGDYGMLVTFTPLPEPSVPLLMALAAVTLMRRRK